MTEIFPNISQNIKDAAQAIWNIAIAQKNPVRAADFLNNATNHFANIYSEEEVDFLRFYFQTQLEMMKK